MVLGLVVHERSLKQGGKVAAVLIDEEPPSRLRASGRC